MKSHGNKKSVAILLLLQTKIYFVIIVSVCLVFVITSFNCTIVEIVTYSS